MANGGEGHLSRAWSGFDVETRVRLVIDELDKLHWERQQLESRVNAAVQRAVKDAEEDRAELRQSMARMSAIGLTILGGVLTGLVLLVVQIAAR